MEDWLIDNWKDDTPVEEAEWWPGVVAEVVAEAERYCWVEAKMDEAESA